MKIFQRHTKIELENCQVVSGYTFVLAKNAKDACFSTIHTSNISTEIYALEVTEKTVKDEIKHNSDLIKLWSNTSDKHKDIIIKRLKTLNDTYKYLIKEYNRG